MTTTTRLLVSLGCLLAACASAEEAAAPSARENTAALLESCQGYQEHLCGPLTLGLYLGGGKPAGTVFMAIAAVGENAEVPDAGYTVHTRSELHLGSMVQSTAEEVFLAADLSLLDMETISTEQGADGLWTREERYSFFDGKWSGERVDGEEKLTRELELSTVDHGQVACQVLLAKLIAARSPASYEFDTIAWNLDGAVESEERVHRMTMTSSAPAEFMHRGEKLLATVIEIAEDDESVSMKIAVSADGNVLSIMPVGVPMVMVAGTSAQIQADIVAAAAAEAAEFTDRGAQTPGAAVKRYMEVVGKLRPGDDLDIVMDWGAIRDDLYAGVEPEAIPSVGQFAASAKANFASSPATLRPEELDTFLPLLQVKEEGDDASVQMPGQNENPFRLKRIDGAWRITRFPR